MPALVPDREQVVARLRRYAQHMEVLNQIARIATQDVELRPMLQRVTDALAAKFDWEFVACVSIDSERQRFVCEAVTSRLPTEVHVGYTRPLGSGVVGEVAATGRPILIDDVSTHSNYVETLPGAASELCFPVHHGGRVVAIINLESTRLAAFHDRVALLATIADQIAGAIESARRFDEVRRRAEHLVMVGEVSRAAMESGELMPLLDRVTAYIQQRLGLSLVAILLTDEREGDLVLAAFSGTLPLNVVRGARLPAGKGVIGRAVREGGPQLVLDVSTDPDYVMVNPDVAAELDVPIHFQGRLLGVVNTQSMSPAVFSHENVALLRTFTDQVAGAIAGAGLHDEVRRRAGQLEMVSEISRTAMEATELQALLDRVVAYIEEKLRFSLVAVMLFDEKERVLEHVSLSDAVPPMVSRGGRWPIDRGIIGRAVREGVPQLVPDVTTDPDYVASNPAVRSELVVPIRLRGRTLGVLNLESTDPAAFTPDVVTLLRTIADQVAGAIHMVAMNESLADANRTLSDLFARYVAPDLAESLIADPDRFRNRGERREVTVLFADIRGFTGLSQRLPSEEVLALLNDYYTAMGEVIFAHRGSINRILGDGLLAVFGVPERLAEHEKAAVGAARGIQEAALRLSPHWESVTGSPLRVAVAVNCGEVVVGTVGDRRHTEFTILGDIVNVASRLEREAKDRDVPVLLTGAVAARLDGDTAVQPLGAIAFRGREGSVEIFRLV